MAAALMWGSVSLVVRKVDIPEAALVLCRVWLGAVGVGGYLLVTRFLPHHTPRPRPSRLEFAGLAATGCVLAVHWLAMFTAVRRLPVATALLLTYGGPVLAAILAPITIREARDSRALVALGMCVVGMALVTGPGLLEGRLDGLGVAVGLASAVSFAALILLGKSLVSRVAPEQVAFGQLLTAGIVLMPAAGFGWRWPAGWGWVLVAILGLLHTAVGGLLYFRGLERVRAQHAGVLAYLEPVSGTAYAGMFLGETPGVLTVIGGLSVLGGGALLVSGAAGREAAEPKGPGDR